MATVTLTLPVSGTVITAGLHATNYTAIQGAINGGLDTSNWASGKIFSIDKLMQNSAVDGDGIAWDNAAAIWKRTTDKAMRVGALAGSGTASKTVFGDGTWKELLAPTHLGAWTATNAFAPVANTAYLVPIANVMVPTTITRIGIAIGTSSGNLDLGIYSSDDESTFTKLFSTGSFASPGAGALLKTIAAQTLTPVAGRRWYWALAADNATITFANMGAITGGYKKAASFALPASLTAMSAPVFGTDLGPAIVGLV